MVGILGAIKVAHEFFASLKKSHEAEDMPFWLETYKKAFPTMIACVNHRQDGDHQRLGIDRSITLENSKQLLIDEKVRFRPYPDILLEYLSDSERNSPGWVCKSLMCDYIAYAVAPLGVCYMLPVIQLQTAWAQYGEQWKKEYFNPKAENVCNGNSWVTLSVAVPRNVVFCAIGNAFEINFERYMP